MRSYPKKGVGTPFPPHYTPALAAEHFGFHTFL